MTKPQESLYWRLWSAASVEQGWNRLPAAELNKKRHAAHANALGRDKSHKDFTNADCDKVYRAFKLLADPTNLAKSIDLDRHVNTDQGDRDRALFRIQQLAAQPYIKELMRQKFGTVHARDLDLGQLDQLRITLIERKRARDRREKIAAVTAPVEETANPF